MPLAAKKVCRQVSAGKQNLSEKKMSKGAGVFSKSPTYTTLRIKIEKTLHHFGKADIRPGDSDPDMSFPVADGSDNVAN